MVRRTILLCTCILSFFLLLSSLPAKAGCPSPCCCSYNNFSGLYAGVLAGLGRGYYFYQHLSPDSTIVDNLAVKGETGGGYLGVGKQFCNNVYLGLEGEALFANSRGYDTQFAIIGGLSFEHDWRTAKTDSLQLAARAGYVVCNTFLPYVKVGIDGSRWEFDHRHGDFNVLTENVFREAHEHKRKSGTLVGFGIDVLACNCLIFGLEWEKVWNKREHIAFNIEGDDFVTFKPRYDQFVAKFSYKFPWRLI